MKLKDRYAELGPKKFARWYLLKRVGKPIVRKLDEFMASQSTVGDPVIFDNADFGWVEGLEANWEKVRGELEAVLARRDELPSVDEIQPDQYKISNAEKQWRAYFFSGFGYVSERNRAECPETARLLDRVPGLTTAFFSVLAPGTQVPPHVGITKGLIRCHLALKTPKDREHCRMTIGGEEFFWREGHAVVFDDTRKHHVLNDTDEERVVLLFDFVRPMSWPGRAAWAVVDGLIRNSPFVRDARRNQRDWEARADSPSEELEAFLR